MRLRLLHPEISGVSCDDCKLFLFDLKTGKKELHCGEPIARPKGTKPPCDFGPDQCPKGHYSKPKELSRKNLRAYFHYLKCKATNTFPDDELVRRNAAFIREIEESVDKAYSRLSSMFGSA